MKRITWYTVIFLFVACLISWVFHMNLGRGSTLSEILGGAFAFYLLPIVLLLTTHLFLLLKEQKVVKIAISLVAINLISSYLFYLFSDISIYPSFYNFLFLYSIFFFFVTAITFITVVLSRGMKNILLHVIFISIASILLYQVLFLLFNLT